MHKRLHLVLHMFGPVNVYRVTFSVRKTFVIPRTITVMEGNSCCNRSAIPAAIKSEVAYVNHIWMSGSLQELQNVVVYIATVLFFFRFAPHSN